ncbi:heterokaryon incompatibility protein-domain-containing protein [Fomes fomentarius]|nr:heterokaryon incompatibility protein-domain-containing protein [Fomes fomentarius]
MLLEVGAPLHHDGSQWKTKCIKPRRGHGIASFPIIVSPRQTLSGPTDKRDTRPYPHTTRSRPVHRMRLLYTTTGHFYSPSNLVGLSYAILSHTWSPGGEQTYQELLTIQNGGPDTSTLSRMLQGVGLATSARNTSVSILDDSRVSKKIRETCRVARQDGYQLVWIDSCCIDKTSSAELSEAINSMYEWYRRADLCYVYLEDVDDTVDHLADIDDAVRVGRSRWNTRGWTLQELIAPRHMVFMSSQWRPLGTKHSLAHHLEDATGIRRSLLNHERRLESIPIAERLSWAAGRKTSREEDEAYSLMGILGVHMTTIYGEGRNAFIRLQEEILKMHPDQSIFAWGPLWRGSYNLSWAPTDESSFSVPSLSEGQQLNDLCGLLGGSPRCFRISTATARILSPISDDLFSSRLGITTSSLQTDFTPTSREIRMRLPLIPMSAIRTPLLIESGSRGPFVNEYLAVLQCEDERGNLVALPLIRTSNTEFIVGTTRDGTSKLFRVWSLSPNELEDGREHIAVTEILIRGRHLPPSSLVDNREISDFMDIPHVGDVIPYDWCRTLLQKEGYELTSSLRSPQRTVLSTPVMESRHSPSISHVFVLGTSDKSEKLTIYIGELALLPNVVVTYQTSAEVPRPEMCERPIELLHRPCTDGRSGNVVVSGKAVFWWLYELAVREPLLRTVRVELRNTTTVGTETEVHRRGKETYWMIIELSEPFRTTRVMRWVEMQHMIHSERDGGVHLC